MLALHSKPAAHAKRLTCRGLKENVAALPPVKGMVKAVRVPELNWEIPAVEGKLASVAIYSYLASTYGKLNREAAERGLQLYDEVVADAVARPGAHPNIDLLFKVKNEGLSVEVLVDKL